MLSDFIIVLVFLVFIFFVPHLALDSELQNSIVARQRNSSALLIKYVAEGENAL